jgi:hypothetical protein
MKIKQIDILTSELHISYTKDKRQEKRGCELLATP